jgi:hypothetical protein
VEIMLKHVRRSSIYAVVWLLKEGV